MTSTEAITALEKALEAGPTQESEWLSAGSCVFELTTRGRYEVNRWAAFVQTAGQAHELSVSDCGRLADYIAACSPLAIRTLLDAHAGALRDAAHWKAEYEKRLRVSIMQGDVIANHIIAMQSAVLEQHYGEGSIEAMNWVKNTLAGPGFMPSVEEAEAIPDPEAEGIAQAWFNAKTAEHEAFRAANPGPAALATNTKGAAE